MDAVEGIVYLSGVYPLARAWQANRGTSLAHAVSWAAAAWLAWFGVLLPHEEDGAAARYFALCLTGCAGIAVLGARRPIVGAWNFVLLGLLAVLLLPLAENALLGTPLLDPLRLAFIVGTIAVGVLNYLPTRLAFGVLLVGAACTAELLTVLQWPETARWRQALIHVSHWLLPAACWIALICTAGDHGNRAEFDRVWLAFRDRFGLMWGQRVREQFNRAAANAGWPVLLRWSGLRKTARDATLSAAEQADIVSTLRELLKRFGPAEEG